MEPKKSFEEKFALVKANKDEGNKLFKAGKFDDAKEKYAETINNLNVSCVCCGVFLSVLMLPLLCST